VPETKTPLTSLRTTEATPMVSSARASGANEVAAAASRKHNQALRP
jgi:hypothetical protein